MDRARLCRRRLVVTVLVATTAVFVTALPGGFVYDDALLIARNPDLQDPVRALVYWVRPFWGPDLGYWRPLTAVVIGLGNWLGGAAGIHAIAVALHVTATWLVFRLALQLSADSRRAALIALLFGLHPLHVESIAWAAAINDPLWAVCALAALDSLVRWRRADAIGLPVGVVVWTSLALSSKENALAAVPLLLIADAALQRPRPGARIGLWVGLGAALLLHVGARALVFEELTAGFGRAPTDPTWSGARTLAVPVGMLGAFVELLIVPWPLTPFRGLSADPGWPELVRGGITIGAGTALWVAAARRRDRITWLALSMIVLPVLPAVLRFRSVGAYPVADRYLYVSVIGFALLASAVARWRAGQLVLLALAALYGALSVRQIDTWHDQASLVEHGLAISPEDPNLWSMHGNLRLAAYRASRDGEQLVAARSAFARARDLAASRATIPHNAANLARAQALLGLGWCDLLFQQTRATPDTRVVIAAFERALAADERLSQAWIGLGIALGASERPIEAERAFQRAVELDDRSPEAHFNLGLLYARVGRPGESRAQLERALALDPDNRGAAELLERVH